MIRDIGDQTGIQLSKDGLSATVNGETERRFREAARGVSVEEFFGDANVGRYMWVTENGKDVLLVNVGKDTTQTWEITVPAQIVDIDGHTEWTNPQQYAKYKLTNVAQFFYRGPSENGPWNGTHERKSTDHFFVVPQPDSTEIEDSGQFERSVGQDLPRMEVGQQYPVPYTFDLKHGAIEDLRQSRIVDVVNTDVFDLSDLDAIEVSGTYNGQSLAKDDFELSLEQDADGNALLVLVPADDFAGLPSDTVLDGALKVTVTLLTHVIDGKMTINLDNHAYVEGGIRNDWTWVGDATGSATSYGTELEVQKYVYRPGERDWTQNLRVEHDEDGNPEQTEFIYRVQLFPHGDFHNFSILDIVDDLPDGTKLLGFVSDQNLESGNIDENKTQQDLDGNLTATLDLDNGTVVISQKPGTQLGHNQPFLNFKVQLVPDQDGSYAYLVDAPIVNKIGATQAVVTVTNGYPLLIQKIDSLRPDLTITDRDARFTITGPNGFEVTDAFVVNGQLMVLDGESEVGIVVPELPDGEVPVGEYGSSAPVTIFNDPTPLYAIGDFTWIDANNNGIQDDDEVLPGVQVDLLDEFGNVLASTETDEFGFYLFDLLPEGDYVVQFTLSPDQAKIYTFTDNLSGDDVTIDSDADPQDGRTGVIHLGPDNEQLVDGADYEHGDVRAVKGIDPTWDAGVVLKSYAIGDYTWIDANRNGIQDDDEVLPGVTVELLDSEGNVLAVTVTDEHGRYLFDELPAGDYQIRFTLTEKPSAKYTFTETKVGSEDGNDSDAIHEPVAGTELQVGTTEVFTLDSDSAALVPGSDYEHGTVTATEGIDPTWDAGVVLASVCVGDRVWIDQNKNGRQDPGEPGIEGVVLTIVGPDGKPVTDVYGNPVTPVTTDGSGNYIFCDLPVLKPGQKDTVSIDRDASRDALKGYLPTLEGQGDRGGDSSTWEASSEGLNHDGDADLTLDFGFILPDPTPEPPAPEDGDLADTGTPVGAGVIGAGILLLVAGAGVLLASRRRA